MRPVMAVALLVFLASCGDDTSGSSTPSSPSEVAVAYTRAVADQDWDGASEFIAPESREAFDFIKSASGKPSETRSDDLAAGSERVDGTDATVVLTGTLCSMEPSAEEQCVENSDSESDNPIFIVHLTRENHAWHVYFPAPVVPDAS
jgi:hypothetical protein